jgi:hypothetical protein
MLNRECERCDELREFNPYTLGCAECYDPDYYDEDLRNDE